MRAARGRLPEQPDERGHGEQQHRPEERPGGVRDAADQQAHDEGVESGPAPRREGPFGFGRAPSARLELLALSGLFALVTPASLCVLFGGMFMA